MLSVKDKLDFYGEKNVINTMKKMKYKQPEKETREIKELIKEVEDDEIFINAQFIPEYEKITNKKYKSHISSRELDKLKSNKKINKKISERFKIHIDFLLDLYKGENNYNCLCTMVVNGDRYIKGAAVLSHSYKKYGKVDNCHTLCLITNDVSKYGIEYLSYIFDRVILVPYIIYPCKKQETEAKYNKYTILYNQWNSFMYTKFFSLRLDEYNKVFITDADSIITNKLDKLFEHETPSGVFVNSQNSQTKYNAYKVNSKNMVDNDIIDSNLKQAGGTVLMGGSILIPTNKKYYINYLKHISKYKFYGKDLEYFTRGSDEISITRYFMEEGMNWHNLSIIYCYIPYPLFSDTIKPYEKKDIVSYQYFGVGGKPWELKADSYEDLKVWYHLYHEMIEKYKMQNITKIMDIINIYMFIKNDKKYVSQ